MSAKLILKSAIPICEAGIVTTDYCLDVLATIIHNPTERLIKHEMELLWKYVVDPFSNFQNMAAKSGFTDKGLFVIKMKHAFEYLNTAVCESRLVSIPCSADIKYVRLPKIIHDKLVQNGIVTIDMLTTSYLAGSLEEGNLFNDVQKTIIINRLIVLGFLTGDEVIYHTSERDSEVYEVFNTRLCEMLHNSGIDNLSDVIEYAAHNHTMYEICTKHSDEAQLVTLRKYFKDNFGYCINTVRYAYDDHLKPMELPAEEEFLKRRIEREDAMIFSPVKHEWADNLGAVLGSIMYEYPKATNMDIVRYCNEHYIYMGAYDFYRLKMYFKAMGLNLRSLMIARGFNFGD